MGADDSTLDSGRARRWRVGTALTLTLGYAGYYFCRSNFSAASPLLLDEFGSAGLTREGLGLIASAGLLLYFLGKFASGVLADFLGGRRLFLGGMLVSAGLTILFGLSSGFAAFLILWSLNRLAQSGGWSALIKVSSRWFPAHWHGLAVGFIAVSYLLGDAAARGYFSALVNWGLGWRELYFAAAGALLFIALACTIFLKASPTEVGLEEPEARADTLHGADGAAEKPASLRDLLGPYFRSAAFWLVCVMSFGLTLIRETFTFWTPVLLKDVAGVDNPGAILGSMLFPLAGAVSAVFTGYASDAFARGNRSIVLVPGAALATGVIGALYVSGAAAPLWLLLTMIGLVSLFLIGPYSLLSGAMALDLGGKKGAGTAAGIIDGVGYAGALLSGWGVGWLAERYDWSAVFFALLVTAALSVLAGVLYWIKFEARRG